MPIRLIERSRHRARITLVNRFVADDEVIAHFAAADAVVLPYHRSSASSPAHVAMSNGLPLVITAVGGLPEAVADYQGAILVPPRDPVALRDAIRRLPELRGRRYRDPHSWDRTVTRYGELMTRIGVPVGSSIGSGSGPSLRAIGAGTREPASGHGGTDGNRGDVTGRLRNRAASGRPAADAGREGGAAPKATDTAPPT